MKSGADPMQMRSLAKYFDEAAARLREIDGAMDSRLATTFLWRGADAERFRSQWSSQWRSQLRSAAMVLDEGKTTLLRNAEEQERASASGGDSAGPVGLGALASAAATGLSSRGAGEGPADVAVVDPGTIPLGKSPSEVSKWWRSLSDAQRTYLLEYSADQVGNLDGVPAWARDRANRQRLQAKLNAIGSEMVTASPERAKALVAQQKALLAIERALNRGGEPTQLLLLDVDGPGMPKAAIAVGDVDTAQHVAVCTPGVGTSVDASLASEVDKMIDLRARSDELMALRAQSGEVAAVTWIGYEIPPNFVGAADQYNVVAGGAKLAAFLDGISASHEGRLHLTAVGHSLGSAVTGAAVQFTGSATSFVALGSPGIMTPVADTLRVPTGQRFVMEAKGDPFADLGYYGGADPDHIPGIEQLSTGSSGRGTEISGHEQYYAKGSTSLHNVAAIVTDNPDALVRGSQHDAGDILRDGSASAPGSKLPDITNTDFSDSLKYGTSPILKHSSD